MRLSVFSKIFLVFLLVVSPLYVLSVYLYTWGRNQIRYEIYTSTLNNIDFYISNVESGIERVINTSVQLINHPDIHYIGALDEWPADYTHVFVSINFIQRELENLQSTFEYVQEAYVLFPHSGVKLTPRSRLTMTELDHTRVNDISFYTGFPFINCALSGGVYINFSSHYHLAHYGRPIPSRIRWIIVTKIDADRIAEDINTFFTGDFDQIAFIGDVNGLTINVKTDEESLPDILERVTLSPDTMGIETIQVDSRNILVAYRKSDFLRSTFVLFAEEQQLFSVLNVYTYWMWIMTAMAILLLIIFTALTRRVVAVPINRLIAAIKQGITGDLNNNIEYRAHEEFEYIYKQFNDMLQIQRASIDKLYVQELMIKDTELKMLQYQINPHFLYNTFFTMYQMLQAKEYDSLTHIMSNMGRYFNFITKSASFIPLSEEMNFCIDYMEIQTIRFSNRITAQIEPVPDEYGNMLIPRLTIQPLLENCFKHGLLNKEEGGQIHLRFNCCGEDMVIGIEDNGDELTSSDLERIKRGLAENGDSQTLGLRNVHKRLQSYFGDEYGIRVARSELGGLLVEVLLPRINIEQRLPQMAYMGQNVG